jgi:hypothetical protein
MTTLASLRARYAQLRNSVPADFRPFFNAVVAEAIEIGDEIANPTPADYVAAAERVASAFAPLFTSITVCDNGKTSRENCLDYWRKAAAR